MDYIIVSISKSLYSDDDDYGLYHVRETNTNTNKGYVIVENRNDHKKYKISVKEVKE